MHLKFINIALIFVGEYMNIGARVLSVRQKNNLVLVNVQKLSP